MSLKIIYLTFPVNLYVYSFVITIKHHLFISFFKVNCACCDKNMSNAEYEKTHKLIHYNLCWINGEEKLVSNNILYYKKYLNL